MAAGFANFPLDVIKANIQGQPLPRVPQQPQQGLLQSAGTERRRVTFWDAAKNCWARAGPRAFYAGLGPSMLRASLVSSSRFSAFEFAFNALSILT